MSQIILCRPESATSTTNLGFPTFQFGVSGAAQARSNRFSAPIVVVVTPQGERSPRTGRLSRSQERALKESADPVYRDRMAAARRHLANSAFAPGAESISQLRLAAGLSQQQLASSMGTSQSHIAKIEAGQVRLYLDTAQRLAGALGVSLERVNALIERPEVSAKERPEVSAKLWVSQ